MGYTVPPTLAADYLWTASDHNIYIRDNFAAAVPDLFTEEGELVVGNGANAITTLSPPSYGGEYLTALAAEATGMIWQRLRTTIAYSDGDDWNEVSGGEIDPEIDADGTTLDDFSQYHVDNYIGDITKAGWYLVIAASAYKKSDTDWGMQGYLRLTNEGTEYVRDWFTEQPSDSGNPVAWANIAIVKEFAVDDQPWADIKSGNSGFHNTTAVRRHWAFIYLGP